MSYERFHTVCDKCKSQGAEYLRHTNVCRECLDDVCEDCAAEYDPEPPGHAICKACAADETNGR